MSQDREELLRLVRGSEEPSSEDEERVLGALQRAITAGQTRPVSERVEASTRVPGAVSAPAALPVLAWVGVGVLSLAAAGLLLRGRAPEPQRPLAIDAPMDASLPSIQAEESVVTSAPAQDAAPQDLPPAAQPTTDAAAEGVRPRRRVDAAPAARNTGQGALVASAPEPPHELAILQRAQAALRRRDGAAALAELNTRAPGGGLLAAELDAARILALCLMGQTEEARAAAARFGVEHETSPQQAVIDGSCANPRRNRAP